MTSTQISPLPGHHRRLRHVRSIIGRSIKQTDTNALPNTFYTLHTRVLDGEIVAPFYTSEIVPYTMNPNWRPISPHLSTELVNISTFVVQVWHRPMENAAPQLLFSVHIPLSELEFLGTRLKSIKFPANSVVIELEDGFYVSKRKYADGQGDPSLIERRESIAYDESIMRVLSVSKSSSQPDQNFDLQQFWNLLNMHQKIYFAQLKTQSLVDRIHTSLQTNDRLFQLLQRRQVLKLQVNRLKEELQQQEDNLKKDKEAVEQARASLLPRLKKISNAGVSLLASRKTLNKEKLLLRENKELRDKGKKMIMMRKWQLISQLRTVFPITQASDGKSFCINDFRLPNSDFTGCDEEQIATALGFAALVTFMVSKYLEIPLRYPVLPMSSRSSIRDEISQNVAPKYPLYSRGVEKTRFEYGVFLLNKDLEQLLNSQGLEVITLRHTLPNLQMLLSSGGNDNESPS